MRRQWTLNDESELLIRMQSYPTPARDDLQLLALFDKNNDYLRLLDRQERFLLHRERVEKIIYDHQIPMLKMAELVEKRVGLYQKRVETMQAQCRLQRQATRQSRNKIVAPKPTKMQKLELLNYDEYEEPQPWHSVNIASQIERG